MRCPRFGAQDLLAHEEVLWAATAFGLPELWPAYQSFVSTCARSLDLTRSRGVSRRGVAAEAQGLLQGRLFAPLPRLG